ncbi:MAG: 23S rRNA pseudouridine(2604) synthase RluF [Bacteroidetes bacterium]|nr:23S rRNA pseudouridine(2604) synthase RluF [Bacteroidota bacterium]
MRNKSGRQIHNDSISLNKYISDTGFCSRREADDYIAQGRVTINHELSEMGNRVYEGDVVEIDGEPIKKKVKTIYLACHKPRGITSTTDQKDKTNIIDFISHKQRIFPIGRLDKESEGLIFLTNDGNIVNKILRAGNNHEKEYLVTVDKPITPEFVRQMSEGVRIMRVKTKPCKVVEEGKQVFRITLTQGLNRQIRRMCDALEYKVKKLLRVRIMNVHLGKLPEGHWRYLTDEEVTMINRMVTESSMTQEASRIKANKKPIAQEKGKQKPDPKSMADDNSTEKPLKPKKPASFKEYRKRKK